MAVQLGAALRLSTLSITPPPPGEPGSTCELCVTANGTSALMMLAADHRPALREGCVTETVAYLSVARTTLGSPKLSCSSAAVALVASAAAQHSSTSAAVAAAARPGAIIG